MSNLLRVSTIKFELAHQMAGRGGRLAPPASKCHNKNVGEGRSFILSQIV